MRKPYTRGFDVEEMLELCKDGWSYSELGRRYGKDHTTILYHCRKHGIRAVGTPTEPPKPHKYDYIFNESINPGKSYKEYLAEAMERPDEKAYREKFANLFDIPPDDTRRRNRKGQFVVEGLA